MPPLDISEENVFDMLHFTGQWAKWRITAAGHDDFPIFYVARNPKWDVKTLTLTLERPGDWRISIPLAHNNVKVVELV